jgi:aspartate racemase
MRTLGLLGGMSWTSTAVYYRLLNEGVAARCGGLHSASLVLASVDFAEIATLQQAGEWGRAGERLGQAGAGLRAAGAEGLLIATNTMHKVAKAVQRGSGLPLLHIGDATGQALRAAHCCHAGLLGTRFSMEDGFLARHLSEVHGVDTSVPPLTDRERLHAIIFDELCRGLLRPESAAAIGRMIQALADRGCDSVILGCTEISLLIDPAASGWPLPLFDTTALHASAAVDWMLKDH